MNAKKGFTLIELLVVIAIIALLLAILIPALKKVKDTAAMKVCMSNARQLAIAVQTYVNDHRDLVPRAVTYRKNEDTATPTTNGSWVCSPVNLDASGSPIPNAYIRGTTATVQQEIAGIRNGYLYPYIDSIEVLHCSKDSRRDRINGGYRSYSLTHAFYDWDYGTALTYWGPVAKKFSEIRSPGSRLMLIEEADPRGANMDAWVLRPKEGLLEDTIAYWHMKGLVLTFADSHSEHYVIQERQTMIWLTEAEEAAMSGDMTPYWSSRTKGASANFSNNEDFLYLSRIYNNFSNW